ncbi:MAG: GAF domain-containing protein [Myxococcales bacterium]|nr:GAF domain-containing protein [Myxococcales bacterium]
MPSPPGPPPAVPERRLALLLERTARLHRLTAHLSTAMSLEDVAAIVVDEGTDALAAHSGALWRISETGHELELVRSLRYPPEAIARVQRLAIDPRVPIADAVLRGKPVWLSSRADYAARYAESASRTEALTQPLDYSVAALPIMLEGLPAGVIALTFAGERPFDADERSFLSFVALHCAQGFERARLYEAESRARRRAEAAQQRAAFLAKASALLGTSLDYEETLRTVASLAVPGIGDWCVVELADDHGGSRQVAVAHVEPEKIELAYDVRRRYPPDPNGRSGVPNVLRTGESELYEEIPDELLVRGAVDEEHLRISRELGLRSAMCVAIKDRGTVLGAITFILARDDRRYTRDDLLMAEQLAERMGAAIANALLYRSAREAIRARDDFMLVAGHELRTPIAAISLLHESLIAVKDGTPLEKIRERGEKLRSQTTRLARLVEELLDVSRLSAGRLSLDRDQVDLAQVVRDVTDRMREELERSRTPLSLSLEPVDGEWDRSRLDQIVTNLVGNAGKYGKGAPIDVVVSRRGPRAELRVIDRGIGIAIDDQPRIFERFERAVSSRHFSGLGLGLWITRQLVEAHGGTIHVDSRPGEGATFTVTLPI